MTDIPNNLPFTHTAGPREFAAQVEFVECMKKGHHFAAHGELWHYLIDGEIVTLRRPEYGQPEEVSRKAAKNTNAWLSEIYQQQ